MLGESDELDIGIPSTGGELLELVSLDGFPIKVTGDHWFPFIKNPVSLPVDECECQMLTKNNEQLLIITRYQSQSPALPDDEWTRECAPILPVQAFTSYKMPFTNYKEALTCASSQGLSAGELGIRYEMARSGKSRDEVLSMISYYGCDASSMTDCIRDDSDTSSSSGFFMPRLTVKLPCGSACI